MLPQRIAAYLFCAVWIGFILLLDPVEPKARAARRFLAIFRRVFGGDFTDFCWRGWICGWLWEFWNNWAAAKWHYIFPMFQQWKIFEMPAPGFLGFLPFALECFAMYVTAAWLAGWVKRVK